MRPTLAAQNRGAAHLLLLSLLIPSLSCHSTPSSGHDPAPEPASPPAARPAVERIDPTYFALGALYEYAGYPAELFDDRIDSFADGRAAEAAVFAQYLERIAKAQSIQTKVALRDGAGGCTHVVSRAMKDYLVAQYPTSRTFASQGLFEDLASKRSYLAGVYLRFNHGEGLRFANSPHKVQLVRELLGETGCKDIVVTRTGRGTFPVFATLSYVPSETIAKMFARVDEEREAAQSR